MLLSACGKKTAAESPVPSTSPTPIVSPEVTKYPLVVKAGTTVTVDLNGDGTQDDVCYELKDDTSGMSYSGKIPQLLIDGTDCYKSVSINQEIYIDNPEPDYYCITDIDTTDKMLEIAIMDYGPSDDYMTHFFRCDGTDLKYLGFMSGMIISSFTDKSDLTFNGDGTISSYMRLSVLQTWWANADWKLADNGFEVVPQELYYPMYDDGCDVTTLVEMYAYEKNSASSAKSALPKGTALKIVATDNKEWVLAKTSDGKQYWIHLDSEYGQSVETSAGYLYASEVLSGLIFAD